MVQVWDEAGSTALGVLRGFTNLTISDVFCDVGSLTLEVPRNVTGAALLDVDADRQIKVSWPGSTAPALWFVNDDDQSTWVSDDPLSEPLKLTCRSLAQVLDEALVYPSGGIGSTPTDRTFTAATPGGIVVPLFSEAQGRGFLQGITLAGDATLDASSVAWPATVPTIAYKTGTSLLAVLKGLRDMGLLEWRLADRTLELHRVGGGLDRTLPDRMLRPRRDVIAAPLTRSRRKVATTVVVEGASSATAARTQTLTGRRKREVYVNQSTAPGASLNGVGDLYLAAHAVGDLQMTHDVTDGDTTPVPWVDYRPGIGCRRSRLGRG
jgi:hypothetical protein